MVCIIKFNKFIFTVLIIFLTLTIYNCVQAYEQSSPKKFRAIAAPFPPFTDPDNSDLGLAWEICRAALESQGYEVSIQFAPWARALNEAKNGRIDGLLPVYWTEDREQWFLYSRPISSINTGLLKHRARTDLKYAHDLKSFKGLLIGVGRGYSVSKEFDTAEYIDPIEVGTTPQLLKMLWLGRLDLVADDIPVSKYYLKEIDKEPRYKGISDDIVVVGGSFATRDIHLVISRKTKNSQQKLNDFNKGLKKIFSDGTYDRIISKYNL